MFIELFRFVEIEGLKLINSWLAKAKKENNVALLKHIIQVSHFKHYLTFQVLELLPVTLKALRTCPVGKNVNKLKNHEDKELNDAVNKLMAKWMELLSSAADLKLQLGCNLAIVHTMLIVFQTNRRKERKRNQKSRKSHRKKRNEHNQIPQMKKRRFRYQIFGLLDSFAEEGCSFLSR